MYHGASGRINSPLVIGSSVAITLALLRNTESFSGEALLVGDCVLRKSNCQREGRADANTYLYKRIVVPQRCTEIDVVVN